MKNVPQHVVLYNTSIPRTREKRFISDCTAHITDMLLFCGASRGSRQARLHLQLLCTNDVERMKIIEKNNQ
jgi:hypothetical protein